jgi:hypothetical protein
MNPPNSSVPSSSPVFRVFSDQLRGGFLSDLHQGYSLRWKSWEQFEAWLTEEKKSKCIDFVRKNCRKGTPALGWLQRHEFVCSRQGAGSRSKYIPQKQNKDRLIPSKRTGCPCRLTVKTYPDTLEILGKYNDEHAHEIGEGNIKFTRLSKVIREQICQFLELGLEADRIVRNHIAKQIAGNLHRVQVEILHKKHHNEGPSKRDEFVTSRDVRRLQVCHKVVIYVAADFPQRENSKHGKYDSILKMGHQLYSGLHD